MFQSYAQRSLNMRRRISALPTLSLCLVTRDAALPHSEVLLVGKGYTTT